MEIHVLRNDGDRAICSSHARRRSDVPGITPTWESVTLPENPNAAGTVRNLDIFEATALQLVTEPGLEPLGLNEGTPLRLDVASFVEVPGVALIKPFEQFDCASA